MRRVLTYLLLALFAWFTNFSLSLMVYLCCWLWMLDRINRDASPSGYEKEKS